MARVYLASDHAGFGLKSALITHLSRQGHAVVDMGPTSYDAEDDYPDFIIPCATRVGGEPGAFGILMGGSGQGEAMAANRVRGARAAVYYGGPLEVVKLSRQHNDANILSLGARSLTEEEGKHAVDLFLSTPFSGEERHKRRIAKF